MEHQIKKLETLVDKIFEDVFIIKKAINELKPSEEVNINTVNKETVPKKRKRYFDVKRDSIIEKLMVGKKKSHAWKEGMSKYVSIIYNNKKWIFQSNIFDECETFSTKEEAEAYYEKIIDKFDIDVEYITRNGYNDTNEAVEGLLQFTVK